MTEGTFRSRIGDTFHLVEGEIDLTLVDVDEQGPSAFALLFEGSAESMVVQSTYTFVAPDGATMPIFIVPLGPGESGAAVYEAVFTAPPPD